MICSNHINQINEVSRCPPIGHSTISNEEVNSAIDALIERITPLYLNLMHENNTNDTKTLFESDSKTEFVLDGKTLFTSGSKPSFELSIYPSKKLDMQNINNGRFYYKTKISRKNLDNKDALSHLIVKLSDQLSKLGYKDFDNGVFDIRFEKGRIGKQNDDPMWHFDGAKKAAITVCWSNVESWSTRVKPFEENQSLTFYHKSSNDNAESSKHGFLYDAQKTFHRAPYGSDLLKLQIKHHRFFIRYNE
jgi:hypothetical protein